MTHLFMNLLDLLLILVYYTQMAILPIKFFFMNNFYFYFLNLFQSIFTVKSSSYFLTIVAKSDAIEQPKFWDSLPHFLCLIFSKMTESLYNELFHYDHSDPDLHAIINHFPLLQES